MNPVVREQTGKGRVRIQYRREGVAGVKLRGSGIKGARENFAIAK